MGLLSIMGNSFRCSASGERLVSAARDGDLQEAKALLEYNPRLVRYYTFGVRNSPLHYSAEQGHNEIVSLLLKSGVDINLRNFRGETALMQACQYGHWEVVQTLILYKANIHKTDYLNGGTALHFAALNGHARCIRLLLADYVPSVPDFLTTGSNQDIAYENLSKIINTKSDGGVTALHMAALNAHVECVQLLLDLGASVSEVTVDDGTTIDLIGPGSTPLHYAACGGNAVCCKMLIAKGASLTTQNDNGRTPLMVARSWNRSWLEGILSRQTETNINIVPSPFLCLPLMSIINIAREVGWRNREDLSPCDDPCAVCLERSCTVAAEGCNHEFCTRCALYLCSTNSIAAVLSGTPGSIPCPLCRYCIVSFIRLPGTIPTRDPPRSSLSLSLCTTCPVVAPDLDQNPISEPSPSTQTCGADFQCTRVPSLTSASFRSNSCQRFANATLNPVLCMGNPNTSPCLVRCSMPGSFMRRSMSHGEGSSRRSWVFDDVATTSVTDS
ncbi:putative E3 ubiquitin-protein ligase XBOS32 isoform X2 [Carex littledalei]|uniref:RING-type E3 ubiquitin transferase n=1 Tax=Carex littledalei TaxID=544730 RepID=A0A833W0G7_9POAL|nr:putative E3 ubiquitin-protein ligase XBOS32 isoform X2 [Carex littledalei]